MSYTRGYFINTITVHSDVWKAEDQRDTHLYDREEENTAESHILSLTKTRADLQSRYKCKNSPDTAVLKWKTGVTEDTLGRIHRQQGHSMVCE